MEEAQGEFSMEIITQRFGTLDIEENQILFMDSGLIGFPELKRFILINMDAYAPFRWLQSIEDETIAFIVLNPASFKPDYTASLSQGECDRLNLDSINDVVLSVIATIGQDPQETTVNLKAPLVFNKANRKGLQLILRDPSYQTQHLLSDELDKAKRQTYQNEKIYPSNQVFMIDQELQPNLK